MQPIHTVNRLGNGTAAPAAASSFVQADQVMLGLQGQVPHGAGGGAGQAVTIAVTFATGELPATYSVFANASQDATAYVSSKTSSGFNVTITPRLAATTLGSGTVDLLVVA